MLIRFSAPILLAMSIFSSSPAAAQNQAPAPTVGSGPSGVVKAVILEAIELPKPKKLPEKARWSSARAVYDGDRQIEYMADGKYYMDLSFVDCNLPIVKTLENKSFTERGAYAFCFEKEVGRVKGFPLYGTADDVRAVRAGHLILIVSIGVNADQSYQISDLVEYLGSIDLAAFAKL